MVRHANKTTADEIREAVVSEICRKEWLYVGLVDTDWRHHEDEEEYLRAGGAVDALLDLARKRGLAEELSGAEAEGRQKLREHMIDRRDNGPSRLQMIEGYLDKIECEVPLNNYRRDAKERERRGYYALRSEKLAIEGDLEIADLALRYLSGEDIESG